MATMKGSLHSLTRRTDESLANSESSTGESGKRGGRMALARVSFNLGVNITRDTGKMVCLTVLAFGPVKVKRLQMQSL